MKIAPLVDGPAPKLVFPAKAGIQKGSGGEKPTFRGKAARGPKIFVFLCGLRKAMVIPAKVCPISAFGGPESRGVGRGRCNVVEDHARSRQRRTPQGQRCVKACEGLIPRHRQVGPERPIRHPTNHQESL